MKFTKEELKSYVDDFYKRNPKQQKPKDIYEKVYQYYDYVRNEEKITQKPDYQKEQFVDGTIIDVLRNVSVEEYAQTNQDVIHYNYYDYFLYSGAGSDIYKALKENNIPSSVLAGIKKHGSDSYTFETLNGDKISVTQNVDNNGQYKYISYFSIKKTDKNGYEVDVFEFGSNEEAQLRQERFDEYIEMSVGSIEEFNTLSKRERKQVIEDFNLHNGDFVRIRQKRKDMQRKSTFIGIKEIENFDTEVYGMERQYVEKIQLKNGKYRYRNVKTGRFVKGNW